LNADVDALDAFLERQNFRLAFWKTAGEELMYRRFFDVNTLVGLRMESEKVFRDTHKLILEWLQRGILDGIRIDHPDGLRDPEQYFDRLREATPEGWIVAEKILEPGEPLRRNWPIHGTTGYDYLNQVGGLFIHPEGLKELTGFYENFTGETISYEDMCREKKLLVLRDILGSDVNRLVTLFGEICESHRDHRDYTRTEIHRALREITACFPVYRTFIVPDRNEINDIDRHYITEATTKAKEHREDVDPELFDFIADVLMLKYPGPLENEFVMRFQQFTGPAMAKGVEDTTFYCYNRLISANEVGGDPGKPEISIEEFHKHCESVQKDWPLTMLATSTHDTKRSEDVRSRIHLLTEMPQQWAEAVQRWCGLNQQFKSENYPDPNTEYLLYQTMVGAWPISAERLQKYMEKATRESKRITSWINPNEAFDKALQNFVEQVCKNEPFLQDLQKFVQPLIEPGRVCSLSQVLLKMTSPGIPDIYQGSEIWDLSLVDPDNRRPVDYDLRRRLLTELPSLNAETIWQRQEEGLPKLWLIHQCLLARRDHAQCFGKDSSYTPLTAAGAKADHVIAYGRGKDVAVVAPRFTLTVNRQWEDTTVQLPEGRWKNQLTGEVVNGGENRTQNLFAQFPVSLFVREGQ
jgi:(1->4)-alpha-D-glucan 1-alpha-D-glucosylmutase